MTGTAMGSVRAGPAASAPLLAQPGASDEILSLDGLDKDDSGIGDRWQIGNAQSEISQRHAQRRLP